MAQGHSEQPVASDRAPGFALRLLDIGLFVLYAYVLHRYSGLGYEKAKKPDLLRTMVRHRYFVTVLADNAAMMFEDQANDLFAMLETISHDAAGRALVLVPDRHQPDRLLKAALHRDWGDHAETLRTSPPALLLTDRELARFDPRNHQWAIIRLSELTDEGGRFHRGLSQEFVRFLVHALESDEDLFEQLEARRRSNRLADLARCLEIRPQVFGFCFDLKRFIQAMS